jgi:glycosyltransferase involved in cell wall biosynthesis
MRIAYVVMDFPVASETFACNDIRMLRELGHDVHVFALFREAEDRSGTLRSRGLEGLPIHYFRPASGAAALAVLRFLPFLLSHFIFTLSRPFEQRRQRLKHLYYALPSIVHCQAILRSGPFDVVHCFWGHYPAILADLLLRVRGRPKLSLFLGAIDLSYGLPITRKVARRADVVFTHARSNLPALEDLGVDDSRTRLVYRGVDLDRLAALRRTGKDGKLWITAGRLLQEKRFDLALRFFAQARSLDRDLRLLLVGSGPCSDDLRALAGELELGDAVTFVPWLPHDELLGLLSESSVLLFFSEKPGEKLPNIVKEAMYYECCCVVGPQAGCDELIEHGVNGFVCAPDRSAGTVDLVTSRGRPEALGKAAGRTIVEQFGLRSAMCAYVDAWSRLIR